MTVKFDPSLFVMAVEEVWDEFGKHEKIGPFLQRNQLDAIVVRIMSETKKGTTYRMESYGSASHGRFIAIETHSRIVGVELTESTSMLSTELVPPVTPRMAAALRASPLILACAGLPEKLALVLLIEAMMRSKHMTRERARELRFRFQRDPDVLDID